jgi:hypothetical protein
VVHYVRASVHLRPSENVGFHEDGTGTSVCHRWWFSTFVGLNLVTATRSKVAQPDDSERTASNRNNPTGHP